MANEIETDYKDPIQEALDNFLSQLQRDVYKMFKSKYPKEIIPFGIKLDITMAGPREYADDILAYKNKITRWLENTPKEYKEEDNG